MTTTREFRRVDATIETDSHAIRLDAVMLDRLDDEARITIDYEILAGETGLHAGSPFVEIYSDGPIDPRYDDWDDERLREQGIPHREWRRVARTRPIAASGSTSVRVKRAPYILGEADRLAVAIDGRELDAEDDPLEPLVAAVYDGSPTRSSR